MQIVEGILRVRDVEIEFQKRVIRNGWRKNVSQIQSETSSEEYFSLSLSFSRKPKISATYNEQWKFYCSCLEDHKLLLTVSVCALNFLIKSIIQIFVSLQEAWTFGATFDFPCLKRTVPRNVYLSRAKTHLRIQLILPYSWIPEMRRNRWYWWIRLYLDRVSYMPETSTYNLKRILNRVLVTSVGAICVKSGKSNENRLLQNASYFEHISIQKSSENPLITWQSGWITLVFTSLMNESENPMQYAIH